MEQQMTKIRADIEENIAATYEDYEEQLPENIQQKLEWFKDQKNWCDFSLGFICSRWDCRILANVSRRRLG